jgi:hypothetical protein
MTDDPINHPKHYCSHPSGVETITITRHMQFNLGNVIKYVMRADHKGQDIQDLEKAMWYLKDEIEMRKDAVQQQLRSEQEAREKPSPYHERTNERKP